MGSGKTLFHYDLIADGKSIAVAVAEKMPKVMKKLSKRKGVMVVVRNAKEEEESDELS